MYFIVNPNNYPISPMCFNYLMLYNNVIVAILVFPNDIVECGVHTYTNIQK